VRVVALLARVVEAAPDGDRDTVRAYWGLGGVAPTPDGAAVATTYDAAARRAEAVCQRALAAALAGG